MTRSRISSRHLRSQRSSLISSSAWKNKTLSSFSSSKRSSKLLRINSRIIRPLGNAREKSYWCRSREKQKSIKKLKRLSLRNSTLKTSMPQTKTVRCHKRLKSDRKSLILSDKSTKRVGVTKSSPLSRCCLRLRFSLRNSWDSSQFAIRSILIALECLWSTSVPRIKKPSRLRTTRQRMRRRNAITCWECWSKRSQERSKELKCRSIEVQSLL